MSVQRASSVTLIVPQTSPNSPNRAKQTHTRQRRCCRHDHVSVKACCSALLLAMIFGWNDRYIFFIFCICLANPDIHLELDCIFGKPMNRRFQRYIVHMQLSTCHAPVEYISVQTIRHSNQLGRITPEIARTTWGTRTPAYALVHRPTPLTTRNGIRIQSAVFPQFTPGQTDRPTHGIGESFIPIPLTLYCTDRKRRAIKRKFIGHNAHRGVRLSVSDYHR